MLIRSFARLRNCSEDQFFDSCSSPFCRFLKNLAQMSLLYGESNESITIDVKFINWNIVCTQKMYFFMTFTYSFHLPIFEVTAQNLSNNEIAILLFFNLVSVNILPSVYSIVHKNNVLEPQIDILRWHQKPDSRGLHNSDLTFKKMYCSNETQICKYCM